MRYAIISDVHANVAALRTVLVDAQDMRADRIICLGDVLGYGPDPVQALEQLSESAHGGAIYLLHSVSSTNAQILGDLIDELREKGYTV